MQRVTIARVQRTRDCGMLRHKMRPLDHNHYPQGSMDMNGEDQEDGVERS